MNRCELLSPAGDYKCFIAALNAGADAIYLGLDKYSARAGAQNFSSEELISALDTAHILGKKVYLTVNTLFKDDEIGQLYDLLYEPYINGLDAVIVQDIGVMSHLYDIFPDLPIHVSTQAGICSADAVRYLMPLGVKRVVPARELSLSEIKAIINDTGIETECFIHGSLCYCYSGKCLMSSFIGGRSGNRGRCAQPCRLLYDGSYPLSLKDLCTIDHIPELIEAGICSFKIEGRMKSSEYVYGVTSIYREYIDKYYESGKYTVDPGDRDRLIAYYTRGNNCNGYYWRHNGADMVTADSPSYSTSAGTAGPDNNGDLPSVEVSISCNIRRGEKVSVTVSGNEDAIDICTDIIPDTAQNRPLTKEEVIRQLSKTGNTVFTFKDIDISIDDDLFIPKGSLNGIRRCALDAYKQHLLSGYHRSRNACQNNNGIIERDTSVYAGSGDDRNIALSVRISVLDKEQLFAAADTDADTLVIPMELYSDISSSKKTDLKGKNVYISLPFIIRDDRRTNSSDNVTGFVKDHASDPEIIGYYVSDPAEAYIVSKYSKGKEIVFDIHMYAYNRQSYDYYKENGCTCTTVPVELNYRELVRRAIRYEDLIVYGRLPMMITANCITATKKGCDNDVNGHRTYITDRKGEKLFVYCNCNECINVIYNSMKLCITDESKLFDEIRPSSIRFSFTDESKDEISRIMKSYYDTRLTNGSTRVKLLDEYTKGHLNRGVD